jgi:hypothetical protein
MRGVVIADPVGYSYRRSFDENLTSDDAFVDSVKPGIEAFRRLLQAMWSIIAEPYVATEDQRVDRHAIRGAQRAGLISDGQVRIVTLRRSSYRRPAGVSSNVEWTHRWIVRPHWRNQWYPSRGVHRQRYIAPYVKGPDDKPLLANESVFALRR